MIELEIEVHSLHGFAPLYRSFSEQGRKLGTNGRAQRKHGLLCCLPHRHGSDRRKREVKYSDNSHRQKLLFYQKIIVRRT